MRLLLRIGCIYFRTVNKNSMQVFEIYLVFSIACLLHLFISPITYENLYRSILL
jgi:hypothetical protein